jgi:hypothetical protein
MDRHSPFMIVIGLHEWIRVPETAREAGIGHVFHLLYWRVPWDRNLGVRLMSAAVRRGRLTRKPNLEKGGLS